MQFSKAMIELVYEIRRSTRNELKPRIKLANPKLFEELKNLYFNEATIVSKALIKELFNLAGPEWSNQLKNPSELALLQVDTGSQRKSAAHQKPAVPMDKAQLNQMKKRIYRGRVVNA